MFTSSGFPFFHRNIKSFTVYPSKKRKSWLVAIVATAVATLTTRHGNFAVLNIERKVLQVHRTEEDKGNSNWIQNCSIPKYSQEHVRRYDLVKVASLFVLEEYVGSPDFVWLGEDDLLNRSVIRVVGVVQSAVSPLLSKRYLQSIFLRKRFWSAED